MSGGRIIIDGLWRALCPSFDEAFLSKSINSGIHRTARRPSRHQRPNLCSTPWQQQQTRRITNPVVACQDTSLADNNDAFTVTKHTHVEDHLTESDGSTTAETLLRDSSRSALHNAPTPVIYETLRALQTKKGSRGRLRAFVKYLVTKRAQKPNGFLYEALIASNCDPTGSAKEVRDILEEMTRFGIEPTVGLYRVALKALAIHPDYLLRNRILFEMKGRWMDLGVEGRCSVALGFLREGQIEMALGRLEEMVEEKLEVPPWVTDLFVVVLAQQGAVDEALTLLHRRLDGEAEGKPSVSLSIWYLLLDEASKRSHYKGTRLVWDHMVAPKTIVPSDGACLNVLNTASRHGDTQLATDVIQILSARNVKLGIHHYEALVDCHANCGSIENALRALCIMANAGVAPENASTRSIYLAFERNQELVRVAADALRHLREEHILPLPALNVVIQGLCLIGDHHAALDLYMQVRSFCACRPEAYTYLAIIESSSDPQILKFLSAEMLSFGLPPTQEQNDKTVQVLVDHGDIDGVFEILAALADMGATRSSWISQKTACALAKQLFATKDERVWGLLDTAEGLGVDMAEITRHLTRDKHGRCVPKVESVAYLQGTPNKVLAQGAASSWAQLEKASSAGLG
ncbi:hypothetical protein DL546_007836 [Coniochaeta pulveracea]|uniref:Pentatricopeptide repeat-containing protein-mitochondrial domain-containing protein n=1 Tax=Coniochaeta pulveracea TaxID=177199 RepID=A0A420YFV8_9PEZI|nr:hypothetical protein DL546_007836 [Coniochaeta pulveracea]